MSILNTISGVSSSINVGGSALSLIGMGKALLKPKLVKGIEGFLFDIPLTENVTFNSTITDHYTEANSSIQDHIAFDPIKITLTGEVSELIYTKEAALAFLSAMIDRLAPLGILSPAQGLQAQKLIASLNQANSALKTLKSTFTSLKDVFIDQVTLNNQQKAFQQFKSYYDTRSLLSIETPWETYTDMAIESWSADQNADSIMKTTFTLTFKEIRTVSTETNVGQLLGRVAPQKAAVVNKGKQPGKSIFATGKDAIFDKTK